ncbi:glycoside hydrolase family 99-like domain-containing protein [Tellurirhabdus rosea]|uniref:glycoside hydrolase family 99-like domain-containing protein n=1 Tax=Tellurirhabdus rosea TaxID=2674997 RepID=UPI002254D76D|nr:glycoside hydrolase family 99-like domain-containing protein [Tellurirhabdus rosea]
MVYRLLSVLIVITGLYGSGLLAIRSGQTDLSGRGLQTTQSSIKLGVYYFDGWTGQTREHLTPALRDSFPEREPVWGWMTSTPRAMQAQIDSAAGAGIAFFNFCWYYPEKRPSGFRTSPLNQALGLYLAAPNRKRLDFSLMVANHGGFRIGPDEWETASQEWIRLFKNSSYVTVDRKPLLSFFSVQSLVDQFGSPEAVQQAFARLRKTARRQGLKGVTLAACLDPDPKAISLARRCGFDVLTGYNYHYVGFQPGKTKTTIDSLASKSRRYWNRFQNAGLPYIPVVTLNWDHRPWDKPGVISQRYEGFSAQSVFRSVRDVQEWLWQYPQETTAERIAMVYAWNEYGEGAWLTPSRHDKLHLLNGVRRALQKP